MCWAATRIQSRQRGWFRHLPMRRRRPSRLQIGMSVTPTIVGSQRSLLRHPAARLWRWPGRREWPSDASDASNTRIRGWRSVSLPARPFDASGVRVRRAHRRSLHAAGRYVYDFPNRIPDGLAASTARQYGYSISPEDGYTVGGTAEAARRGLGSTADVTTFTVDGRAYLHGLGDHDTVAIRGAAGASTGTPGARRTFLLGGALPAIDVLDFGREAISLLRGFPPQSFAGTPRRIDERRLPVSDCAAATRRRHLAAVPPHDPRGGFRRRRRSVDGSFPTDGVKTSVGGNSRSMSSPAYSFPFTATVGARGATTARTARDRGDRVPPRRPSVLRSDRYNCRA